MSKTLTAADAKSHFSEALRVAERGEVVEITRYGRPVAALVGMEQVAKLRHLESRPRPGLQDLVDRFEDGEGFAAALDEVVARRSPARDLPRLDD